MRPSYRSPHYALHFVCPSVSPVRSCYFTTEGLLKFTFGTSVTKFKPGEKFRVQLIVTMLDASIEKIKGEVMNRTENIGVGAQSTSGDKTFLPENISMEY